MPKDTTSSCAIGNMIATEHNGFWEVYFQLKGEQPVLMSVVRAELLQDPALFDSYFTLVNKLMLVFVSERWDRSFSIPDNQPSAVGFMP